MSAHSKSDGSPPTERTPAGHEVPIPKRGEFFDNLKKIAKPKPKPSATGGPKK
jgi:hypothetical protein